jgi:RNA polymerase sigma-70 factor (ECF subfamily)
VLRDDSLAEDVLQDTLVLMYRKLKWVREPASVRPWLYRIATRQALRAIDARRRRAEGPLPDEPGPDLGSGAFEASIVRGFLAGRARE